MKRAERIDLMRRGRLLVVALSSTVAFGMLGGCSSSNPLPSRVDALNTATQMVDQVLIKAHYTGSRVILPEWGSCGETDYSHGDLELGFGSPGPVTKQEAQAFLSAARTVWESAGYSEVSTAQSTPGDQQLSAKNGSYTLAVDVFQDDTINMRVWSCYSTPGPHLQTGTATTLPPLSTAGSTTPSPTADASQK